MEDLKILKDFFDEKIIEIMGLFINNPEKQFYLSEIAKASKINISTTFRILNNLSSKDFLKVILIGKIKMYQLEKNEKTYTLIKFLSKKKEEPLGIFIEKIKTNPRIKRVMLESRNQNGADILLVGDYLPRERIQKIIDEIKRDYNFKISTVEISENQFKDLREFKNYDLEKKIIWRKTK